MPSTRASLFSLAASQEGYFTTSQAEEAGYSRPLLAHHLKAGHILRAQRGVYRLLEFPAGDHEDLVVAWLWSARAGVFSHETALAMHELSDALPARHHLTVPTAWRSRRLSVPNDVRLHFAEIAETERAWFGAVPVTSPLRTVRDCFADHVAPDLVEQAIRQGLGRGLFSPSDVAGLLP